MHATHDRMLLPAMTADHPLPRVGRPASQGWAACAAVTLAAAGIALQIQLPGYLHQDVAFLTWAADKVLRGAVYGRDVLDINPPLSFLIYLPAALLGRVTGFDLAIKLWTVAVFVLAMGCLWSTAERSIRLPVILAMGLFFALAFPREFGQREQFALLLCAPYAAGAAPRRGLAVLNGVLAGIGFAMKPYFLVPLALIFLTRRRIRAEEWSIAVTGTCYAAIVLLFFQPWLRDYLPDMLALYWGNGPNPMPLILLAAMPVPLMVAVLWMLSAPQRGTAGFAMAALGFTAAVILHRKGFPYHFVPAYGFLSLYLAASTLNTRPFARVVAAVCLLLEVYRLSFFAVPWFRDAEHRRQTIPALLAEIDKVPSFTVLSNYNYPAFPTAILTKAQFLGLSPTNNYISSVAAMEAGVIGADGGVARARAVAQAVRELSRRPALVIVETQWQNFTALDEPFDGLAWFDSQPAFHALWKDYVHSGRIGEYEIYRLK